MFSNNSRLITSPVITTSSVLIVGANNQRIGLWLYNNSANSVYISVTGPANSSTNMSFLVATFATWYMPADLIYTGAVYGIRNAGTGRVLATEFY